MSGIPRVRSDPGNCGVLVKACHGLERAVAGLLEVYRSVTVPSCESCGLDWQGSMLEASLLPKRQHPPLVPLEADAGQEQVAAPIGVCAQLCGGQCLVGLVAIH